MIADDDEGTVIPAGAMVSSKRQGTSQVWPRLMAGRVADRPCMFPTDTRKNPFAEPRVWSRSMGRSKLCAVISPVRIPAYLSANRQVSTRRKRESGAACNAVIPPPSRYSLPPSQRIKTSGRISNISVEARSINYMSHSRLFFVLGTPVPDCPA